jgi:hypothetical protein
MNITNLAARIATLTDPERKACNAIADALKSVASVTKKPRKPRGPNKPKEVAPPVKAGRGRSKRKLTAADLENDE